MSKMSSPRACSLLMVLAVAWVATPGFAQTVPHQHEAAAQAQTDGSKGMGDAKTSEMKMGEMKKMMADKMAQKAATDDRLAKLMVQMKNAAGDAKVAAMSDVVELLVQERAAMEEHCTMMMKMMNTAKPAQ